MQFIHAKEGEYPEIYSAMQQNFCLDEIRDYSDFLSALRNVNYNVYHIVNDDIHVGFIGVWNLTDCAFVEHFVVYEQYRNRGLGGAAIEQFGKMRSGIILESEPPVTNIQRRRIAFYERHNFKINECEYFQSSYRVGGNDVKLLLLSYPVLIKNVKATIKEIYHIVYGKE
jgi:GNAT superfamily N-acetyltransferase